MRKEKEAHELTYAKTEEGGIISLGVFHSQEFVRFAVLLKAVLSSLKMLDKAIKGLVVMSAELEEMFNCFNIQKVPEGSPKGFGPTICPVI